MGRRRKDLSAPRAPLSSRGEAGQSPGNLAWPVSRPINGGDVAGLPVPEVMWGRPARVRVCRGREARLRGSMGPAGPAHTSRVRQGLRHLGMERGRTWEHSGQRGGTLRLELGARAPCAVRVWARLWEGAAISATLMAKHSCAVGWQHPLSCLSSPPSSPQRGLWVLREGAGMAWTSSPGGLLLSLQQDVAVLATCAERWLSHPPSNGRALGPGWTSWLHAHGEAA